MFSTCDVPLLPATAKNSAGWNVERPGGAVLLLPRLNCLWGDFSPSNGLQERGERGERSFPPGTRCLNNGGKWCLLMLSTHWMNSAMCWGVEKTSKLRFFPNRRRVSSLGRWMVNEVRQAAGRLAESFSAWMDSRKVCSILHMVQSHIPVFTHFVPFCPSIPPPLSSLGSPSPCETGVLLQQRLQIKAKSTALKSLPRHNTENRRKVEK